METILDVRKVWGNGVESSFPALKLDEIDELKQRTGVTRVVAFRWRFCGKDYETSNQISVLQDKRGLVQCQGGSAAGPSLIVLNGDGSQRVVIGVPRVDANSRPEEGYLSLPPALPASVESNGAARATTDTPTTCSISIGILESCCALPGQHGLGSGSS